MTSDVMESPRVPKSLVQLIVEEQGWRLSIWVS